MGFFGSMGAILSIWRLLACLGSRIYEFTEINCDHDDEFARGRARALFNVISVIAFADSGITVTFMTPSFPSQDLVGFARSKW